MSSVPAQVAADAAKADEMLKAMAEGRDPTQQEPQQEQAAEPQQEAEAEAPREEAPKSTADPVFDQSKELARLQQALNTAVGRLEHATAQNSTLVKQMEELKEQVNTRQAEPEPPPSLVTDQDIQDYGSDLIDMVTRVVKQQYETRLKDVQERLSVLEGRVGRVDESVRGTSAAVKQTAAERYEAKLTELLPNWESVNEEPELLDWLEKSDNLSGIKYRELLGDAHNAMDAKRVVSIFTLYLQQTGRNAPSRSGTPAEKKAPKIDPATLAAPNTASAPSSPTGKTGKMWTQEEVNKLYADKVAGRITQQVFAKREQEYLEALAEGRVSVA